MGEAPRPRSPPRYPDLCGRRRLQLEVQILNREVGFLEQEIQGLERVQPVSRCCKDVNEFVNGKTDPMIPVSKRKHGSCSFSRWIRSKFCTCFSCLCCWSHCLSKPKAPSCFNCSCCACPGTQGCTPSCSCCFSDCSCVDCPCSCPSCSCEGCSAGYIGALNRCLSCLSSCGSGLRPSCCKCQSSCCEEEDGSSCCWRSCCSVSKPSCPGCSCGCVWSCRKCTEGCRCSGCRNPCCATGCLC